MIIRADAFIIGRVYEGSAETEGYGRSGGDKAKKSKRRSKTGKSDDKEDPGITL